MKWRDLARIFVIRPLLDHPLRAALAVLGIACGTALYVAIAIINAATIDHFAESVSAATGTATLSVQGGEAGFPEETLEIVEKVPGVDRVVPVVQVRARAGARHEQSVVVLGVDMLRESAVRAYRGEQDVVEDPLELLNQDDGILTTRAFAEEHHLAIGAPLVLSTPSGPHRFVVRGILGATGPASAFGGRVVFMDIDAARVSFGKEGRTDRLDVVAKKGVDEEELRRAVGLAIGHTLRTERPSDQTHAFKRMIAAYQRVLDNLARLALIVAVFLIGSTMTVAVAERRKEIGLLRAIGATRRVVLTVFLATASALGLSGALVGLPLGRVLAAVLVKAVSRSVALTYATPIEISTLRLPPAVALVALVSGLLAALVGGLAPAIAASNVPCVEALRPNDVAVANGRPATARVARNLGIFLLGYVGVASAFELDWRVPVLEGTTLTVAYLGGALVAPWLSSVVLRLLGRCIEGTPLVRLVPFRLAVASLGSSARASSGSSSLIAALMLVLVMTTAHASLASTLNGATSKMLSADIWVSENGLFLNGDSAPLRDDLKTALDAIPGVDVARSGGAHAQRMNKLRHGGRTIVLKAWDPVPSRLAPMVIMDGGSDRANAASIDALFDASRPTLLVSENFAKHFAKRRGDIVTLDTPSGRIDFTVVGVILELASLEGTIYMSRDTYRRLWNDPLVTMFYAFVEPGASPSVVRDRIDAAVGSERGVIASVTSDVRGLTEQVLDDAFAYTRAVEAAALLIGLFGLLGTMLVSVLERKRELGMLRAVGATRIQVAATILTESALVGISASLTALVLGGYLAHVWLGGSLTHDLGWPIAVHVPALAVLATIAAGIVTGMLAGVVGGHRAMRVELRDALSYE